MRVEAYLDIVVSDAAEGLLLHLDTTVRHPGTAGALQRGSARKVGVALTQASREKHNRYPASDGFKVTPLTAECWGRIGYEAEELIEGMAQIASRRRLRAGELPINFAKTWRSRISTSLQIALSMSLHDAFFYERGDFDSARIKQ